MRRTGRFAIASLLAALAATAVRAQAPSTVPAAFGSRGVRLHDPSTIVKCNGQYWIFSTGPGVRSWRSKDLLDWQSGPRVFERGGPEWVLREVPQNRNGIDFWAPDVIHLDGRYLLYYSVSSWGKNTSCIALASNGTLDPNDPDYRWTDEGVVIRSTMSDNFNAIDPAVMLDADGKLWMAFGSFWGGIQLVQLDRATGKRIADDSTIRTIAARGGRSEIEAPAIHHRDGKYYLFVNWGLCCRGMNSTYEIRVGRADRIEGPYVDKDGRDLREGGGTLLLASDGPFIGPGHPSVFSEGGQDWLGCHFYDPANRGRGTLAIRPLGWAADGWPVVAGAVLAAPATAPSSQPIIKHRADPWVLKHADGFYYFMATVPEYDRLELRRAKALEELASAEAKVIWRKHATGPMGAHIWAPEIHHIGGKWYVYFAAGGAEKVWDIRMYVLENGSPNPLEGEWVERGQIKTNWESFSLDATTFEHRGTRYLLWAQRDPMVKNNTDLYIAKMDTPMSIVGEQVMLSRPELEWEQKLYKVNEAPAVLIRNGRIFLTYSASGTDANYCVGLLTASEDADLLDPKSWTKSPQPVLSTSETHSIFGPGHNCFTTTPDGKDVLVYHARDYREIKGDPLRDPNRHTRFAPLTFTPDGTPDFAAILGETTHAQQR